MKNVILIIVGAILGSSIVYLVLPKVEKNTDEVFLLEKDFNFQTGQAINQSQAKKFYKTYIRQRVKKNKYSRGRSGDPDMNNKDKERYLDLDSKTIRGIQQIQDSISPNKPDTVGLRLFLGIQKLTKKDTDYVYMAVYNPEVKGLENTSTVIPRYYIIDIEDKKSPTCPIECDSRDYENPF
jgi:hypothetical protein